MGAYNHRVGRWGGGGEWEVNGREEWGGARELDSALHFVFSPAHSSLPLAPDNRRAYCLEAGKPSLACVATSRRSNI